MATAYDHITIADVRDRSARRRIRKVPAPKPAPPPPPSPGSRALRRWSGVALLLAAAALMVAYISNVIAVNRLLTDATRLENSADSVRTVNQRLRADLLRLMAPERITSIASMQLGMTQQTVPSRQLSIAGTQ